MKLFKLFTKVKETPAEPIADLLYEVLGEEKYAQYPYRKEGLGEEMYVINRAICGYWKPVYLIDERNKGAEVFMNGAETLQTVSVEDIDWESLNGLQQDAIDRAKALDAGFPTFIYNYKDGVAKVSWQINPDGRYYMDEDGYGMTNDKEITVYGFIDRAGKPLVKFRYVHDSSELDVMEKEARKNLKARKKWKVSDILRGA